MKIELDLTPEQYQQLVECYFAGSIVLEDFYPDPKSNMIMDTKINSPALTNGMNHLVFTTPDLEGVVTVSHEVEDRVLPILFGE